MDQNVCGWFEIPVVDMDRAIRFYKMVLQVDFKRNTLENIDMAWFPFNTESYGTGGALVCNPEFYIPSENGSLLYLSSGTGDLDKDAATIEQAGGQVIIPKRQISPEHGYMLIFIDCEGNRVALHSNS